MTLSDTILRTDNFLIYLYNKFTHFVPDLEVTSKIQMKRVAKLYLKNPGVSRSWGCLTTTLLESPSTEIAADNFSNLILISAHVGVFFQSGAPQSYGAN